MDKKWIFITVILGILILVLAGELYLYFTNKQKITSVTQKATPALPPPDELSIEFDPTVNSAVFNIDFVNADDSVLHLDYAWPESLAVMKVKVSSKITCVQGDIKLTTKQNPNPQDITLAELFTKAVSVSKENSKFSGLCKDKGCSEINKNCRLSINN
ncbi:MAG TPA: hypothetical protein VFI61_01015 [Patescibacteria group bacterium]|nr:hypothetical protein [Patescibacteria group bacterium]